MNTNEKYLFLVVVGGKSTKANIELHDVRWLIGSRIEDTFEQIRNDWFGEIKGLHIDSYKKITNIDGYKIVLYEDKEEQNNSKNKRFLKSNSDIKLWFVNLGGYKNDSMIEHHRFGLFVANSSQEAITRAKRSLLTGFMQKHKDDISDLTSFVEVDDCQPITQISSWRIDLVRDNQLKLNKLVPDWYGYMRIDN